MFAWRRLWTRKAGQYTRIDAADTGELDKTVGIDGGDHHADFVHVRGDHDGEVGIDGAALRGGEVAEGVDFDIGDVILDGGEYDIADLRLLRRLLQWRSITLQGASAVPKC